MSLSSDSTTANTLHINDLPSDILSLVFELVGPDDCVEASSVSKRWSQLAARDVLWSKFQQIYLDQNIHTMWHELVNLEKRSPKSAFLEWCATYAIWFHLSCKFSNNAYDKRNFICNSSILRPWYHLFTIYSFCSKRLLNFRPEIVLDLLSKSLAAESDTRESYLAKVLPALSTPTWWRYYHPFLIQHHNLYAFSHKLKDMLEEEDFKLHTIKSDRIYHLLWKSCALSVASEGLCNSKQASLDEKEAFSMMRMYWSMKNPAAHNRNELKMTIASSVLFITSYLLDIPLRTKATIFALTNLVALPSLHPWTARFLLERISAPLALIHFATHWTTSKEMLLSCGPIAVAPFLVGLHTPWYAQIMFAAGAALRSRYLPVSGSIGTPTSLFYSRFQVFVTFSNSPTFCHSRSPQVSRHGPDDSCTCRYPIWLSVQTRTKA